MVWIFVTALIQFAFWTQSAVHGKSQLVFLVVSFINRENNKKVKFEEITNFLLKNDGFWVLFFED